MAKDNMEPKEGDSGTLERIETNPLSSISLSTSIIRISLEATTVLPLIC